jgi:Glycosyl transferase family 2
MDHMMVMRDKLSAFVITYNRSSLLETCLRAASFADELIVVDKSSTDNSTVIAARYADRVEVVPWSPTVEETRAYALSLCQHNWVLCLDDDEILSAETGPYLRNNMDGWDVDILAIPLRHYILGVHDERAYYWPEEHHRLFRKGAVEFIPTVHGGAALQSDRIASIPADSGVCIHHLSYQDVASWIERSNRYTSRPDRIRAGGETGNLIRFAHERIDYWMQRTDDPSGDDYPAAVALLRAIYDMVDRLKAWETERGVDGAAMFRIAQQTLVPAIDGRNHRSGLTVRDADTREPAARQPRCAGETAGMTGTEENIIDERRMEIRAMEVQLRTTEAQLRERIGAARTSALSLSSVRNELDATVAALAGTRHDLVENRVTLQQTSVTLDETQAMLDETRAALAQTQETLDRSRADLKNTRQEFERLSNSGRIFIRQYLPKLWRHLSRRLG